MGKRRELDDGIDGVTLDKSLAQTAVDVRPNENDLKRPMPPFCMLQSSAPIPMNLGWQVGIAHHREETNDVDRGLLRFPPPLQSCYGSSVGGELPLWSNL